MRLAEGQGAADDPLTRAALVEHVRVRLQVRPPYPILGLAHPALTPSRLVDLVEAADRVVQISLGYGETESSAGRYVLITSSEVNEPLEDLAALLAAEARRVGEDVTQDPPMAPELTPAGGLRLNIPMEVDGLIVVDGLPVPAHLRRQGRIWAAHITITPGRVVTVVARGVDPGTLQLSEVADLRPYVKAWEEHQFKAVAEAAFLAPQGTANEPPAQGLEAHVALMRVWLTPRPGRGRGPGESGLVRRDSGSANDVRLWDTAVRMQAHYSKQTEVDADAAVASMVNQAVRLAERASWIGDGARVERAVEELARFTIFESDVPSRRAQEWWGRVWSLSVAPVSPDPAEASERHRELTATEAVWLSAWERWAAGGHSVRR